MIQIQKGALEMLNELLCVHLGTLEKQNVVICALTHLSKQVQIYFIYSELPNKQVCSLSTVGFLYRHVIYKTDRNFDVVLAARASIADGLL